MMQFQSVAVLVVALAFGIVANAECAFKTIPDVAIESEFSVTVQDVATVEACLSYLKNRKDFFIAVEFKEYSLECCAIPSTAAYTLVPKSGVSAYFIAEDGPAVGTTAKPGSSTTTKVTTAQPPNNDIPDKIGKLQICGSKTVNGVTIVAYGHVETSGAGWLSWNEAERLCKANGMLLAQLPTTALFDGATEADAEARSKCYNFHAFVGAYYSLPLGNYYWTENGERLTQSVQNAAGSLPAVYMRSGSLYAYYDSSTASFGMGMFCTTIPK